MTIPAIEVLIAPFAMPTWQGVGGDRAHILLPNVATAAATLLVVTVMYDTLGRADQSVTSVVSPTLGALSRHSITPYIISGPAGSDPAMAIETWSVPVGATQLSGETITVTIGGALGADSAFAIAMGVTNTGAPYFDDMGGAPLINIAALPVSPPAQVTYSTSAANELVVVLTGGGAAADRGPPSGFTESIHANSFNGRQIGTTISYAPAAARVNNATVVSPISTSLDPNTYLVAYAFLSPVVFTVPNVVGSTLANALAALAGANLLTTLQQSYSPTVANGSVISQNPGSGTSAPSGSAVIINLSQGPAPIGGNGGDQWGATGGGVVAVNNSAPIGQTLSYAQHAANAVDIANFSVMAALSSGALPLIMSTPDYTVPTTPRVGT